MRKKMYGGLALLVSAALLAAGCAGNVGKEVQSRETASSAQPIQNKIVQSIESQVKPLKTLDPNQPFDDLKPLKNMIGAAHYVGLGENNHGSSEIFTMKFRLVKYLVTEMGFTNFAMEEDWGNGLKLNDYIQTGQGDPREFLKLLYPTDEIIAMVEWMKDYNANSSNKSKIQFIGLDLKTLDPSVYDKVIDYVKQHHPDALAEVEESYKELPAVTGNLQDYMKLAPEAKERFKVDAQNVVRLLDNKTKQANPENGSTELIWIRATAKAIENFTTMMNASDYPSLLKLHEQFLADHAMWAQEALGGKTMIWGHNIHVAKGIIDKKLYPEGAGQFLKNRLGDQYVVMGSTTTEGSYTLYSQFSSSSDNKLSTNPIPQDENSSNDTLGQVSHEMFLLDHRHLKGEAEQWVREKRGLLSLGAQVVPNESPFFDVSLLDQFDLVLHIRQTSPSHMK
ncbi:MULTISPECIES: erythromycin esterase family protein [Paenibacillus]|uniref:erythromycin esterase family protein n=1 Tax=Paenibacillus TaxID=44249 RepID=UPI0022B8C83B|nr:erythromycin esterase family protein [Paenibacillus caseinilyticus]MCZ8520919.1 erythromycin esterase family protein [Paenibacillus caseinilyticus]